MPYVSLFLSHSTIEVKLVFRVRGKNTRCCQRQESSGIEKSSPLPSAIRWTVVNQLVRSKSAGKDTIR